MPGTLYGVSKLADEGMARVYAADTGLPSIGLRPYVVYGPGRDQGMTSGPTMAMLAAARGEPYAIGYTGTAQYDYAPGRRARLRHGRGGRAEGAAVYNPPGVGASVEEVVAAIRAVVPDAAITWGGEPLPFPHELESVGFDRDVGAVPTHAARRRGRRDHRALPRRRVARPCGGIRRPRRRPAGGGALWRARRRLRRA